MLYNEKPKMILFDVGGTLFEDGHCDPVAGFSKLLLSAINPQITTPEALSALWDEYLAEVGGVKSKSGITLDAPLSAIIKYACMHTGVKFNIPMAEQEEIFDRYNSDRTVIDGIPELLLELKKLGIRTAVISNNAMSGESLELAIKHWIPCAEFEFYLTSADLLLTKPCKNIFTAAVNYAGLSAEDCWYCGDSLNPDVGGSFNSGLTPVLYDKNSSNPFEMRTHTTGKEYLAINHWDELRKYLITL